MESALVTAIGSFSADIVIKTLKKKEMNIIGTDIYPKEWIADAYNVDFFYQVPRVVQTKDYLNSIKRICAKHKIKFILPLTDVEVDLFNQEREWFDDAGISLCISSSKTLELCRNKLKTVEFILSQKLDINIIPTERVSECENRPFDFPLVCKPYDGRSSQGLKIVHDEEDWKRLKRTSADESKMIVQPFINGNIVTVDVIRHPNGHVVSVAREELLRTQNGAGTSVRVFEDAELTNMSIKLANALNIIGCVNFEFILSQEREYYFIECNPRFSGGVEFTCIAGYDAVCNHMRCFSDLDIDDFILSDCFYIARKYEEYVTKKSEILHINGGVDK